MKKPQSLTKATMTKRDPVQRPLALSLSSTQRARSPKVWVRSSKRLGVCGSCGMMVNGQPKLTCAAFLSDELPGPIRVEPLNYFPIMRDLVVDITDFLRKLTKVKP